MSSKNSYLSERIALFIDGSNFHSTTKLLNLEVDYLKLLSLFKKKGQLIRAYYYTALPNQSEISPLRKLTDFLDLIKYSSFVLGFRKLKRTLFLIGLIIRTLLKMSNSIKMMK